MEADADKSGLIDKDELYTVMCKFLEHFGLDLPTKKEIAEIMFNYDVSRRGELTYEDFSTFIHDIFKSDLDE